jgi:hypothetical protein
MTSHEWANELTAMYTKAHSLRQKAICEGPCSFGVDVRCCMDVIIARLDLLNRTLGDDILKSNGEERV